MATKRHKQTPPGEPSEVRLDLPYPPSLNHYWRRVGAKTLISRQGRAYREQVARVCQGLGLKPLKGRLVVTVLAFPPDNRRRDLDNLGKALLDSLQAGGAYLDDSQVDCLTYERHATHPGGMCVVLMKQVGQWDKLEPWQV